MKYKAIFESAVKHGHKTTYVLRRNLGVAIEGAIQYFEDIAKKNRWKLKKVEEMGK